MTIYKVPYATGADIAAFPVSQASVLVSGWLANAVEGVEDTGDNAGRYSLDLNDAERFYAVFAGVPASFLSAIGMVVTTNLGGASEVVYFLLDPGLLDVFALPESADLSAWPAGKVDAVKVANGLYSIELSRADGLLYRVFTGSAKPVWSSYVGTLTLPAQIADDGPSAGLVTNLLSVDYEDDWVYLDGIEDCGFAFGPQRSTALVAPASGVKVKRSSPSQSDAALAAMSYGFEATDMVMVVWAQTLYDAAAEEIVTVHAGDRIVAFDGDWVVKSVKRTQDFAQWRCMVRLSSAEARP